MSTLLPASFSDVRLSTERLMLRPFCPDDAEALFRMHSDPEFMRYWSCEPWASPRRADELIQNDLRELAAGEHVRLGIFFRNESDLIGTCSLFHLSPQCRRAEVGYGIRPDYWRQGYMSEAVGALIDFAFGALGLNRLEADIDPRNVASARSLEKLGFAREGLLRERWIVGNEVSDSALYGLLAKDWLGEAKV
ncbi:GNAT family N-acetyltransferase [Chromobacterium sp. IIBBL 290-4]|uniref:GNAT family N-acetyltransferase n=1 Tax=Chromobacterium sp. IIBBL 290-4 TaxID=2953890 RepID=UPI0020B8C017|nr:GNAT family N-acetyltransferase [Chromobacterium sp. IIBBL 290-4]UTH74872.1 GNAT family N-acetyltransferase [Chromobacterium sp. IIBBL 290-4]